MEFDGRSVLVTGGSSGIGLAAARLFAARGGRLFAARGGRVACADVAAPPDGAAGEAIRFVPADVTNEEAVGAAVEFAIRERPRCASRAPARSCSSPRCSPSSPRRRSPRTRQARARSTRSRVPSRSTRHLTGCGRTPSAPARSTRRCCASRPPISPAARRRPTTSSRRGAAATRSGASPGPKRSPRPSPFLASDRASFITGVALPVDGGLLAQVAVVLPDS